MLLRALPVRKTSEQLIFQLCPLCSALNVFVLVPVQQNYPNAVQIFVFLLQKKECLL